MFLNKCADIFLILFLNLFREINEFTIVRVVFLLLKKLSFFPVATFSFANYISTSTFLTFKQFPCDLLFPSYAFKLQANQISETVFMECCTLINCLLKLYAIHFFHSSLLCPQLCK